MFTKEITGLTLASNVADKMFPNLNAENYRGDESFKATLRALLHSRVTAEESVSVFRTNSRYMATEVAGQDPTDAVSVFLRDRLEVLEKDSKGIFVIHSFDNNETENEASFELLDAWAKQGVEVTGFEPLEDLALFFQQKKIKSRFYINKAQKNTLIFLERMDIKKWHIIQLVIPRCVPWYFTEDKPLTTEEATLAKTLVHRYAPDYERCIESFANQFDFRTAQIELMMSDFESKFDKDKLRQLEREMANEQNRIESARGVLMSHVQMLEDLKIQHLGLHTKIMTKDKDKESELLNFCLCNKAVNIIEANDDGSLYFVVATTISNFDPDLASRLINNSGSCFYGDYHNAYRDYNTSLDKNQLKMLWEEIFLKERLKLRTCASYTLFFKNPNYKAGRYDTCGEKFKDYTPNQHIYHYGCLGNNEKYISQAVASRDFVAAITACISSASNMNMSESNTVSYFLKDMLEENPDRKCIQLPNGECATPVEAVTYLEKEKEEKAKTIAKEKTDE